MSLTIQSLATDLNIRKLGHRFDIMWAIRDPMKATGGGCANNETQFGGEPQYLSEGAQTASYNRTVKFEKKPHSDGHRVLRRAAPQVYHTANRSLRSKLYSSYRSNQSRYSHESQKLISSETKLIVTYTGSEEINHVLSDHFRQFDYDV